MELKTNFQKLIKLIIYLHISIKLKYMLTCQSRNRQKNTEQHSAMNTMNTSTQTQMLSIPYHL
jgi:NAD kinase